MDDLVKKGKDWGFKEGTMTNQDLNAFYAYFSTNLVLDRTLKKWKSTSKAKQALLSKEKDKKGKKKGPRSSSEPPKGKTEQEKANATKLELKAVTDEIAAATQEAINAAFLSGKGKGKGGGGGSKGGKGDTKGGKGGGKGAKGEGRKISFTEDKMVVTYPNGVVREMQKGVCITCEKPASAHKTKPDGKPLFCVWDGVSPMGKNAIKKAAKAQKLADEQVKNDQGNASPSKEKKQKKKKKKD